MDFQLADLTILMICAATCVYCFVLGRRLSALHDTKRGLGAAIVTFTRSVKEISATAQATTARASELALQLTDLIEKANHACQKVEEATVQVDTKRSQLVADLRGTQSDLNDLLHAATQLQREHTHQVRSAADDLYNLTEGPAMQPLSESLTKELRRRTDRMKAIVDHDAS